MFKIGDRVRWTISREFITGIITRLVEENNLLPSNNIWSIDTSNCSNSRWGKNLYVYEHHIALDRIKPIDTFETDGVE